MRRRSRWCDTSWRSDWRIERATRSTVTRHASALMALDAALRKELGDTYSDESWSAESFEAERPAKWRLSRLAFEGQRLCAFWIASRVNGDAHTHRVGVDASLRQQGVFRGLANEVHEEARRVGARRMTLYVTPENVVARHAYERLGYQACVVNGRPAMERLLCA